MHGKDTIAALATAPGRAGIGIIRVSGPKACQLVERLVAAPVAWKPRVAMMASWRDEDGQVLDQGLMLFFPAPHSYTGEDVVELHAHGSPVLLRALLSRLYALGCRPAEPGEFTRRALLHGKMDLSQAEAVIACIDAATVRAGKQAQRHLQGVFGDKVAQFMEEITELLAYIEACLDFSEEEIPALDLVSLRQRVQSKLIDPIQRLLGTSSFGMRLFEGARVAIIGAPNVGKSSLLNALTGQERAIVSDVPGTTRDVLDADFEIHGIPVRLVDTAGLRRASDQVEREGIRRARREAEQADLVIFVADAGREETWRDGDSASVKVMNKVDLCPDLACPSGFIPISVRTGAGMSRLRSCLASMLEERDFSHEDIFVTCQRHAHLLNEALLYLREGAALLGGEDTLDLVASRWRSAYGSLGEIIGVGDVERILDRVFSRFCIGK
ncbi:MAG: tRNA uridine-5-carboxymethylaminomethyl(34) synthesis GTPase MnmE [Zetaproteobacteria bacterium]|nr:MAG: tRNA uridine-5-carboxymethylaminomethyl(34) synthesis GTPase MnmE [Zetaproteobacteria bacterium]